jgi:hypothetical protein
MWRWIAATALCYALGLSVLAQSPGSDSGSSLELTTQFRQSSLAALADLQRWKEKAKHDAQGREPAPTYGKYLKIAAQEAVSQAKLLVKTEGDQQASIALENLFSKMSAWTDRLIAARTRLDATHAMDPESVDKDDEFVRINACGRALHALLLQRSYTDVPQCR